jgi:hypothetical protein
MSARTDDGDTDYRTVGVDASEMGRYDHVALEDGAVIIYDEEDEESWVQSTSAIGLEFMI